MSAPANPVNPDFPSTASEIEALRAAISPARLTTYLKQSHQNMRRAIALHAWNMQAGASLYPLLQLNEVVLRNAVSRALISQFGAEWPYSMGFLRGLPQRERETFEHTRRKLERSLCLARVSTGDVVAAQTYWFWVMLLTSRFEQRIWKVEFRASFPYTPPRIDRHALHARAELLRTVRNRIAHYEPLLNYDLMGMHQRVVAMIRWISPVATTWAHLRWPADPKTLKKP